MKLYINISYHELAEQGLQVITDHATLRTLTKEIKDFIDDDHYWMGALLDELGGSNEWGHWDTQDDDMKHISRKHPDIYFCVHSEDEDDEEWETWYHAGNFDVCSMMKTFEEPDLEKLG